MKKPALLAILSEKEEFPNRNTLNLIYPSNIKLHSSFQVRVVITSPALT